MRVLQLIDSLRPGGAERMAVNIANLLKDKHIENRMFVTRDSGLLEDKVNSKTDIQIFNKKSSFDLSALYFLCRATKKFNPSLIHAHSTSIVWGVILKWINPNAILLWHDHYGLNVNDGKRFYMKFFKYWIDLVIVVKPELEIWCHNYLKIKNVKYLYNFPLLDSLKLPRIENQLICVANFRQQKGQLHLLKAISILRKEGKLINLKLVGQVVETEYYQMVLNYIKEEKLSDTVEIDTVGDEIETNLFQSEIGILSSISEGLPVALLEYGIAGLAVIVTSVGSNAEVVEHKVDGLCIPPGDVNALKNAISFLLNHRDVRNRYSDSLQKKIKKKFSSDKFWMEYNQLVQYADETDFNQK